MSASTKQVRFNEDNLFYSPSPSLSESSLPSSGESSGPRTPPQNNYALLPLPNGPVAIHPLLAFHPYVPSIIYNVSLLPNTLAPNVHASPQSLTTRVLDEPATQPAMHTMTLVINQLPWRLTTKPTKHYVSVRDLLEALYCFLRHPVLPSEYNMLPMQALKDEVSTAFHNRCGSAPSTAAADEQYKKGVKRVDFLRGRTRFMGLSSTKVGPNVWTLNLA
ncbi:hypothetical protein HD554DRAFT_2139124 [Boletus coccyginus]|nr:hypothetical protein HD554DRAFT_2139124 [Boletus coccyginus]